MRYISMSSNTGYLVLPHEAEQLVEGLLLIQLEDIGSSAWIRLHGVIEKLNLQAHQSAKQKADNFVIEAIITFKKMEIIIQSLLMTEIWKEKVFQNVSTYSSASSLRTYFMVTT